MRLIIARVSHETNTFSPVATGRSLSVGVEARVEIVGTDPAGLHTVRILRCSQRQQPRC
jgi:microcystin degradation protein MlrC